MTFRRLISNLSVRVRIIALAIIPVIGFLANGIAFTSGEKEVERAFTTVRQADALAEASRDFKSALELMRVTSWDFAVRPSNDLIKIFQDAPSSRAEEPGDDPELAGTGGTRRTSAYCRAAISALMANFINLLPSRRSSASPKPTASGGAWARRARAVERLINQDMSWLLPVDAQKLLNSLLIMRRYEAEFRLNRVQRVQQQFFEEFKTFNKTFDAVVGAAI